MTQDTSPATSPSHPIQAAYNARRGIAFMVLAVALFCAMDALIKWLSDDFTAFQILLARSLVALPILGYMIHRQGGPRVLVTRRPWHHVLRATFGSVAFVFFALAFARMPLADAYAIAFAAPLMITALSIFILGEQVGWRRWAAIAVGFSGMLLVLQPGAGVIGLGAVFAIMATFCYSMTMVLIRWMSHTESNLCMVVYTTLAGLTLGLLPMPWLWVTPGWIDAVLLTGLGLLGLSSQFAVTEAFRSAPASVIAPFDYTGMIWGIIFGLILFGDVPGGWMLLGATIIAGSGLYILHRESAVSRQAVPALPARAGRHTQ